MIIDRFGNENPINRLEPVMTTQELIELKERVKEVRVEDCLKEYIINIVDRTRKDNNVVLGCSPRGSLNLYRASKAWAFIKEGTMFCRMIYKKWLFRCCLTES